MFTCEHYDVSPDILVIGKGLGGGVFPLAGIIAESHLNVASNKALGHYTHEKNPVACAAALATIDHLENNGILERVKQLGKQVEARITRFQEKHPIVKQFRGLGLLMGIEVVAKSGERRDNNALAETIMYHCLSRGLNFKLTLGNTLTLTPPLTISDAEMEAALDILETSLLETEQSQ